MERPSNSAAVKTGSDVELIAMKEVIRIVGLSRSEICRRVAEAKFPQPVKLGKRCTRWERGEVVAQLKVWLQERPARYAKSAAELG